VLISEQELTVIPISGLTRDEAGVAVCAELSTPSQHPGYSPMIRQFLPNSETGDVGGAVCAGGCTYPGCTVGIGVYVPRGVQWAYREVYQAMYTPGHIGRYTRLCTPWGMVGYTRLCTPPLGYGRVYHSWLYTTLYTPGYTTACYTPTTGTTVSMLVCPSSREEALGSIP